MRIVTVAAGAFVMLFMSVWIYGFIQQTQKEEQETQAIINEKRIFFQNIVEGGKIDYTLFDDCSCASTPYSRSIPAFLSKDIWTGENESLSFPYGGNIEARVRYIESKIKPEFREQLYRYLANCDIARKNNLLEFSDIVIPMPKSYSLERTFFGDFNVKDEHAVIAQSVKSWMGDSKIESEQRANKLGLKPLKGEFVYYEFSITDELTFTDLSDISLLWLETNNDIAYLNKDGITEKIFSRYEQKWIADHKGKSLEVSQLPMNTFLFLQQSRVSLDDLEIKYASDDDIALLSKVTLGFLAGHNIVQISSLTFNNPEDIIAPLLSWRNAILEVNQ